MKILEVDGHKYSRETFKNYGFRAKVVIGTTTGHHNMDIYTTDPDKVNVENVLLDRRADKVMSIQITYWCTKEDDDIAAEFIEEILKDI